MSVDEIIDIVIISNIEEYNELKNTRYWDFYIAGICYGVFLASEREMSLEVIKNRIESGIKGYFN